MTAEQKISKIKAENMNAVLGLESSSDFDGMFWM